MLNLSNPQKAIYELDRSVGGSVTNLTGVVYFPIETELKVIKNAISNLIVMNEVFRNRIFLYNGVPMQTIESFLEYEIPVERFKSNEHFDIWVKNEAKSVLNIFGKLYQFYIAVISNQIIGVVIKIHHIISDAWTFSLVANQIIQFIHENKVVVYPYSEYIEKEANYKISDKYVKDKEYWLNLYSQNKEINYLIEKDTHCYESMRKTFVLSTEQSAKIKKYCESNNVSEFALFLSIISTYYYRITGKDNFYIGTPIINRSGIKEKSTIGIYINTIPISICIESEETFQTLTHNISSNVYDGFKHQQFGYSELLKNLPYDKQFKSSMFDVTVSFQNIVVINNKISWYSPDMQKESLQVHINDHNGTGVYTINYDYQIEKFTDTEISKVHMHLSNLLNSAIDNKNLKLYEMSMLTEEESLLLHSFNDTYEKYNKNICVHELFEQQVKMTPDKIALIQDNQKYTYYEINQMANSLAFILQNKGVTRGDIVAIIANRSYKVIVAQLAILKAGGAYMPIDINYPKDRINFMLENSNCKIVLTHGIDFHSTMSLDLSQDDLFCCESINIINNNSPNDLCYCIYTSGSTGKPKGTLLNHKNVLNYCNNNQHNIISHILKEGVEVIGSITTIGFDIFLTESLLSLLNGLTIVFANDSQINDQNNLNTLLCTYNVDAIQTTPSKITLLISDPAKNEYLSKLKIIIIGGEPLEESIVSKIQKYTNAKILNVYGPTETTVWSTLFHVKSNKDITIGKPIANTQIYILDKHQQLLPTEVVGELYIAGDGVGLGYLNHSELTTDKFLSNPFGCGMMYKTGDLAKWREDGNIIFIGRMDNQVKIRGLRIEMGEIENIINGFNGVNQVAVVEKRDNYNRQFICAYYVGEGIDVKELKKYISNQLPQYMIPHFFIKLETFPTMPNGKTDRKAFPTPDFVNIHSCKEYVAPKTERELALCKAYEEVLKIKQVGIYDDFFELGGDSLKAIELSDKLSDEFNITVEDIYKKPTINKILDKNDKKEGHQNA